jgi:hypothetical protein
LNELKSVFFKQILLTPINVNNRKIVATKLKGNIGLNISGLISQYSPIITKSKKLKKKKLGFI